MRPLFPEAKIEQNALSAIKNFHSATVAEVQEAVSKNKIVVIGMRQNPACKKATNILASKGVPFKYLEYGSYFSMWKPRLAIKLWSGWPTYPQVFIDGTLIGGCSDLESYLKTGGKLPTN